MKIPKLTGAIALALLLGTLAACASPTPAAPPVVSIGTPAPTNAPVGMANPASTYCVQQGGKVEIRKTAQGEAGYCVFPDKSECDEWAYFRGECKFAAGAADPFAYCATVGNLDAPDARWTGPKMPDAVLNGLIKSAQLAPDIPRDMLAGASFWRCMNGKVYACTVGANLPCQEKADTNKTPSAAMNDFCKANPTADAIPAAVTGRATVYQWKCAAGKPEIVKQQFTPDARGFLAEFWYEIASAGAPGSSIANPASTFCVQNGGKLEIRKDAKGGEVGYCIFPDKSECEEWAFMRGECKPGAKPIIVTKAENGKTIEIAKGSTLVVTLQGNPGSTGYLWGLEAGNDTVLKPQGDYKFTSTSNMPGASGTFEFRFTAASAGSATLKFANKRPWELNDPKAETFSVTVNVK
jgi:putative hemolysin/predicted secreted protein